MKTLLITAIAGDIAQAIALIVREVFPEWRILGMDIHERHGAELYVDQWFQAPPASSVNYLLWLEDLIRKEKIDFCLPMSEAELLLFEYKEIDKIGGASLIMPNPRSIRVGADKLITANFLTSIGCPAPWTIPAEACMSVTPFPCIFKPRRGAGSKGIFICRSLEEVHFLCNHYPNGILQELLLPEDREVTCAVFRGLNGRTAVLQLLRKLVGGFTGWAQTIYNDEIQIQCERLAEALELKGSINVQLRITSQGPRIFEINPRFSSTVLIRHLMGYQDVVWVLKEAMGAMVDPIIPAKGVTAVRIQGARLLSTNLNLLAS